MIAEMQAGTLAYIDTPAQGNRRPEGVTWVADNGCYSDKWDERKWWAFLTKNAHAASTCLFATAPDVVGDAVATLAKSTPWLAKIRELGYPVAFVAQDGIENTDIPWSDFDALFVGGTDSFKLGPIARDLCHTAKIRGKHVHVGRVNSGKRFAYVEMAYESGGMGADSADGTYLVFGPDTNLPKLLGWVDNLFGGAA